MKRILSLTFLLFLCSSCGEIGEREIHLIPAGYVGRVYILHNISGGVPLKREGSARLYEIPPDGVLRSQSSENLGWHYADKFFYVASNGTRTPITQIWYSSIPNTPENRADKTIGIFSPGTVGTYREDLNSCEVKYDSYYVGSKSSILTAFVEKDLGAYLKEHPVCK